LQSYFRRVAASFQHQPQVVRAGSAFMLDLQCEAI
jgi:hypothetical protein